ncbi:unnamed protein product [Natator depressus]
MFRTEPSSPEAQVTTRPSHLAETQQDVILFLEVTDQASIKAAAKKVGDHLKGSGPNLLINSAGTGDHTMVDSANPEDVLTVHNTNLTGPMSVTAAARYGPLWTAPRRD